MKKPVSGTPVKTPSRKSTSSGPRKRSPQPSSSASRADAAPRASKNILTAGIKALTHAHEEAVARQSRVFESLLGLGPKRTAEAADEAPPAATTLDPFGFRKFEDVFDQRVARALQNLQVPSAEAFAALTAEVERLREAVAALEAQAPKQKQAPRR